MLGIERQRNAPVERRAAHGQVTHAALDEGADLVLANLRADEVGVLVVVREQLVAKLGEFEKPILLVDDLDLAAAVGTLAVNQVAFGELRLARRAIVAVVGSLVEVAVVMELLHEVLDALHVARLRRADEVVVGDIEVAPQLGELRHLAIAPLLWRHAVRGSGLGDLLAMLVHAGEEEDIAPVHARETCGGVSRDSGVRGTDVRLAVNVVDGRGYVEGFFAHGVLVLTRTDMLGVIIAGRTRG